MAVTPNLGLTRLGESEVNSEAAYNENLIRLDLFCGPLHIQDRDLTAPPGTEVSGQVWLVNATATDEWLDHDDELAGYYEHVENGVTTPIWLFQPLKAGMVAYVEDEGDFLAYDGATWNTITVT